MAQSAIDRDHRLLRAVIEETRDHDHDRACYHLQRAAERRGHAGDRPVVLERQAPRSWE